MSWHTDCIFEIYQQWQSDTSRMYSNYWCSRSFEQEIIKIGQSSYNMYSNNILDLQESTTILNDCTKKKRLETYWRHHIFCSGFHLEKALISLDDLKAVTIFFLWRNLNFIPCPFTLHLRGKLKVLQNCISYILQYKVVVYVLCHINICAIFNAK